MEAKQKIRRLLRALGGGSTYMGFEYLTEGVLQAMDDPSCLKYITKGLYMDLAETHHTAWKNVERDMRTVIVLIWEHGDRELLEALAGKKLKERPRNGEFIRMIALYISPWQESAATEEEIE